MKENDEKAEQIQFDKERFIWPVKGKVISRFGIQPNKMNYNGIRIAAAEGTAVQAAAGGRRDLLRPPEGLRRDDHHQA